MSRSAKIVSIFGVVSLLFSACGGSGGGSGNSSGSGSGGDSTKLTQAFATNCASCHGTAGGGGSERSIQGYSRSLSSFLEIVRSGAGRMPSFSSSQYSDSDASADFEYLRSL